MIRVIILGLIICSTGCSKGPKFVEVTGQVLLEGKPVRDLMINFTPQGKTEGSGAMALLDAEGKFKLTAMRGEPGILAGEYKVSFWPTAGPSIKPDDPADVVATPKKAALPSVYLDANQTPLRITVPETGGVAEILLTKSGQGGSATMK